VTSTRPNIHVAGGFLVAHDIELHKLCRDSDLSHAFHRVCVARAPRTAHVTEKCLH
jgi:hypothetical protein